MASWYLYPLDNVADSTCDGFYKIKNKKKKCVLAAMVAYTYDPTTHEAKAGDLPRVGGLPGQYSESQAS